MRDHHIQSNREIIVLDSNIQSNWDMRALSHCMWSNWGMRAKEYDIHHSLDTSVKCYDNLSKEIDALCLGMYVEQLL